MFNKKKKFASIDMATLQAAIRGIHMAINQQEKAAQDFAEFWKGKEYEKGMSQQFWDMLLRTVLGVETPESFIEYEDQVMIEYVKNLREENLIMWHVGLLKQRSI